MYICMHCKYVCLHCKQVCMYLCVYVCMYAISYLTGQEVKSISSLMTKPKEQSGGHPLTTVLRQSGVTERFQVSVPVNLAGPVLRGFDLRDPAGMVLSELLSRRVRLIESHCFYCECWGCLRPQCSSVVQFYCSPGGTHTHSHTHIYTHEHS